MKVQVSEIDVVPIGPFRSWLNDLLERRKQLFGDDIRATSRWLGIDERRIREMRDERVTEITIYQADEFYCAAAEPHRLQEHYPSSSTEIEELAELELAS